VKQTDWIFDEVVITGHLSFIYRLQERPRTCMSLATHKHYITHTYRTSTFIRMVCTWCKTRSHRSREPALYGTQRLQFVRCLINQWLT